MPDLKKQVYSDEFHTGMASEFTPGTEYNSSAVQVEVPSPSLQKGNLAARLQVEHKLSST